MTPRPRSHLTRLFHALTLSVVIHQLIVSTFMERPLPGDDPDWPYLMHVWAGTGGLPILFGFWLWILIRDVRETRFSEFFPWFSPRRLRALLSEIDGIRRSLRTLRQPSLDLPAISASAHGAGLLLATGLATTGGAWHFLFDGTPYGRMVLMSHKLAGNLMWAYLVGHVTMAALHQWLGDPIVSQMFWLKSGPVDKRVEAAAE